MTMNVFKFVFLLCLFVLAACGKETVTVTIYPPGSRDTQVKNLMHIFTAGPPVGFCQQPGVIIGIIQDSQSTNSTVTNQMNALMSTNLPVWGSGDSIEPSTLVNYLNNGPSVSYQSPIQFEVRPNVPIEIGLVGNILAGTSTGSTCVENLSVNPKYSHYPIADSITVTPTTNTTVNLPVKVTNNIITTAFTSTPISGSSVDLNDAGIEKFLATFIKLPPSASITSFKEVRVKIKPRNSNGAAHEVDYLLLSANTPVTNPTLGAELPSALPPSATSAYSLPHVFPMTFTVRGTLNATPSIEMICTTIIENESTVERYPLPTNLSGPPVFETLVIHGDGWSCVEETNA